MGLGMLGAIGGAGEGLSKQGAFWAEEKKQARIAEMRDKYAIKAEERADVRKREAEVRADTRLKEKEQRDATESDRLAARKLADQKDLVDYRQDVSFEMDKKRQEQGIHRGTPPKPRSPFELSNAYIQYKNSLSPRERENMLTEEEFAAKYLGGGTTTGATSSRKAPSEEPSAPAAKEKQGLMGKYGASSKETEARLRELNVPTSTLTNMKRAISSGKLTTEQAAAKLKESGYPDDAIIALMAEIELSGL